jgi:DNA-3-methyladenine glycosylase I
MRWHHRCDWPFADPIYKTYHDTEWGVPETDSRALYEKLILDGFQAGLSWITILRKREEMRREFDGFDPEKLVLWSDRRIARALQNPGVIRSPIKIAATLNNARVYLDMQARGEDFADYVWAFVDGKPIVNRLDHWRNVPARTELSDTIARDMKTRGFKFCGPIIVYAVMQAMGMVNDHEVVCPRHKDIQRLEKAAART